MDSVLRKEYFDKAFKLHNAGSFDEAKTFYNKIVSENSNDAEIYNLIGICELQQQNYAKAEEYVKHAIELRKNQYFYEILAQIYHQQKRYEDETTVWHEAESVFGLNYNIAFSLGLAYKNIKNARMSEKYYLKAVEFNPKSRSALFNIANLYTQEQEIEKAKMYFQKCLELDPEDSESKYFLSHSYFRLKDYEHGLPCFESRLCRKTAIETTRVTYPKLLENAKMWQGEDISDKILYTYYEAGFGDMIMFARYIPELLKRCKKLIIKPQIELYQLFKENFPQVEVMEYFRTDSDFTFDYHIPFLSVPYVLGFNAEDMFVSHGGYLKADTQKVKLYKEKLFYNDDQYKIAIKWQGNTYYETDRVINVEAFAPLFDLKNTQVYSAQTFEGSEEFQKLADKYNIIDISKTFKDFSYTAAALKNMDLVICSDTSLAHLAGAMGIPCAILLPYNYNWRWHTDLSHCDWYDSVKLYRTGKDETWEDVVLRVVKDIKSLKK